MHHLSASLHLLPHVLLVIQTPRRFFFLLFWFWGLSSAFKVLTTDITLLHESYGVFSKYLNLQNAPQNITALLLCHSWVIRFRECELQSSFATESNICNRLKVCDCKMGLPSASAKYMTPKNSLLSADLNQIPNTVLKST